MKIIILFVALQADGSEVVKMKRKADKSNTSQKGKSVKKPRKRTIRPTRKKDSKSSVNAEEEAKIVIASLSKKPRLDEVVEPAKPQGLVEPPRENYNFKNNSTKYAEFGFFFNFFGMVDRLNSSKLLDGFKEAMKNVTDSGEIVWTFYENADGYYSALHKVRKWFQENKTTLDENENKHLYLIAKNTFQFRMNVVRQPPSAVSYPIEAVVRHLEVAAKWGHILIASKRKPSA